MDDEQERAYLRSNKFQALIWAGNGLMLLGIVFGKYVIFFAGGALTIVLVAYWPLIPHLLHTKVDLRKPADRRLVVWMGLFVVIFLTMVVLSVWFKWPH